jgi:hypothetical protein
MTLELMLLSALVGALSGLALWAAVFGGVVIAKFIWRAWSHHKGSG